MFEHFTRQLRVTVKNADSIARSEGSSAIEAQHLLLAILENPSTRTADAIQHLGLTTDAVVAALRHEFGDALRAVGVTPPSRPHTPAAPRPFDTKWGQSAKLALERTIRAAAERGDKRLDDRHLLLGIARAEAGVIPRTLDRLGLTPTSIDLALA